MNTLLAVVLLSLAIQAAPPTPAESATEWMQPAALGLETGMSTADVMARLEAEGLTVTEGKVAGEQIVEYAAGRTITLQFRQQRLVSLRFELVDFLPMMRKHWTQLQEELSERIGEPDAAPPGLEVRIWTSKSPNVMAALSMLQDDEFGKQGLGYAVVRYFEPPAAAAAGRAALAPGD